MADSTGINPDTGLQMNALEDARNGSNNPLTVLGQGQGENSAKMAMTPQAKQGSGTSFHPWTSKGTQTPFQQKGTETSGWNTSPVREQQNPAVQPQQTPSVDTSTGSTASVPPTPNLTTPSIQPPAPQVQKASPFGTETALKTYQDQVNFQQQATQDQITAAQQQAANTVLARQGLSANVVNIVNSAIAENVKSGTGSDILTTAVGTDTVTTGAVNADSPVVATSPSTSISGIPTTLTSSQVTAISKLDPTLLVDAKGKQVTLDPNDPNSAYAQISPVTTMQTVMGAWQKADDAFRGTTDDAAKSAAQSKLDTLTTAIYNLIVGPSSTGGVQIDPTKLGGLFGGDQGQAVASAIGFFMANGMTQNMTLSDQFLTHGLNVGQDMLSEFKSDMGKYLNLPTITTIDPTTGKTTTSYDFTKVTYQQMVNSFQSAETQEYSRAMELERTMQDPSTPRAERQAIEQELRSFGYTGTLASQATMQKLSDQLQSSTTQSVNIYGKTYKSLEDALNSTNVQALVTDYIEKPQTFTGDKALPSDLVKLINDNKDALTSVLGNFKADITQFNDNQKNATALAKSPGGVSPAIFKQLTGFDLTDPDTGFQTVLSTQQAKALNAQLTATGTDGKPGLIASWWKESQTGDPAVAASLGSVIAGGTAAMGKDFNTVMSNMSSADIQKLSGTDTTSVTNRTSYINGLSSMANGVGISSQAQQTKTGAFTYTDKAGNSYSIANGLDAVKATFGITTTLDDATLISNLSSAVSLNVAGASTALDLLTQVYAAKTPAQIAALFADGGVLSQLTSTQLADVEAVGSGASTDTSETVTGIKNAINNASSIVGQASFTAVQGYLTGKVNSNDPDFLKNVTNAFSGGTAINLTDTSGAPGSLPDVAKRLAAASTDSSGNRLTGDALTQSTATYEWNLYNQGVIQPLLSGATNRDNALLNVVNGTSPLTTDTAAPLAQTLTDLNMMAGQFKPEQVPVAMKSEIQSLSNRLFFPTSTGGDYIVQSVDMTPNYAALGPTMLRHGSTFSANTVPSQYADLFATNGAGKLILNPLVANQKLKSFINDVVKFNAVTSPNKYSAPNNDQLFEMVNNYLNAYTATAATVGGNFSVLNKPNMNLSPLGTTPHVAVIAGARTRGR